MLDLGRVPTEISTKVICVAEASAHFYQLLTTTHELTIQQLKQRINIQDLYTTVNSKHASNTDWIVDQTWTEWFRSVATL